jgi:hypothetical protein
MTVRSFNDEMQHDYIRHIEVFARLLGRSPDTATGDDVRHFQLAQVEQGAQPPKMNAQASAVRFFFTITLGPRRPRMMAHGFEIGPLRELVRKGLSIAERRTVRAGQRMIKITGLIRATEGRASPE